MDNQEFFSLLISSHFNFFPLSIEHVEVLFACHSPYVISMIIHDASCIILVVLVNHLLNV